MAYRVSSVIVNNACSLVGYISERHRGCGAYQKRNLGGTVCSEGGIKRDCDVQSLIRESRSLTSQGEIEEDDRIWVGHCAGRYYCSWR
jgi:hypothetical protein